MILSRIAAINFNGWTFNTKLNKITVLVSDNFSGKTSRLLAATYALTGKLPGLAEAPADIYERFASGSNMVTQVDMDNGWNISRGLEQVTNKKGETKVESVAVFNGFPDKFKADPILFDPAGQFLSKSDKERSQYLFRTLPPPDMTQVGPDVITANLKNIKLEPHTPEAEQFIGQLCGDVAHSFNESKLGGALVQDWLASLVEGIRLKANAATASAKRMKETMLGTTQLKNPDALSLAAAEGKKQKAAKALEEAVLALNTARTHYKQKDEQLKEARRIAASYVPPTEGQFESVKADIDRLTIAIDACTTQESSECQAKVDAAKTSLASMPNPAPETLDPLWNAQRTATSTADKARGFLAVAQSGIKALEVDMELAAHRKTCPACGQNTEEIQKKVIAGCKAKLKEAAKPIKGLTEAVTKAEQAEAQATQAVQDAKRVWTDQHNAYGLAQANVGTLEANYQAAAKRERDKLQQLANELRTAEAKLAALQQVNAKAEPALAAQQSIPGLEQELFHVEQSGVTLKATEASARQAHAEADHSHRQALADAASAQQVAKAGQEADKAQMEADVLKQLSAFLAELLDKCVAASVAPLLAVANSLCQGVLTAPLAYKDGVIGMYRGSLFRSWRAFSGVDNALSMAALSLGLATFTHSPLKIVALDEMGCLSRARKVTLLTRLKELVKAGTISQAILIDVDKNPWTDHQDELTSVIEI